MILTTTARRPGPARLDLPDAPETLAQVLASARDLVASGWTQGRWSRTSLGGAPEGGRSYCLLGGVVVAAGGPRVVESQLTQRSLDLVWHVLRRPGEAVRFNPGPQVRLVQIRQLVGWNDRRGRTQGEVVDLLDRSAARADGFALPGVLSGRSAACP